MDCSNSDCNFNIKDNTNELLILQLKEEVKKLLEDTQAQFLLQNKKIAETCVYIKENLSNEIRLLLDTMQNSGELDTIITDAVINSINACVTYDIISSECDVTDALISSDYISVEVKRSEEYKTSYLVTRVKHLKPYVNFTNGTNKDPYKNNKNVIDYMKGTNKLLAINSGLRGVTVKDRVNFINENTASNEGWYILGIKPDGSLKAYPRLMTAAEIINDGCRDAVNIWLPLVLKGSKFDIANIDSNSEDYDYIINGSHPRQVIGTMPDGSYIIVTSDGRMKGEKGFTIEELQQIMLDLGCVDAYNLDGGASTQTVIGKRLLNRKLSESRTIGTVFTFEREVI